MELQQGSIVWATVRDPAGRNPKSRPLVVVTPTEEIDTEETLVAVAITSTFRRPLPENCVELPWKNGGHPVTGLNRRCVAVCHWLVEIRPDDVLDVGGVVPPAHLAAILTRLPQE